MAVSLDLTDEETRKSVDALKPASMQKPSLIGMSREAIGEALLEAGIPQKQIKMRVSQIWHWLYVRGISDFADMKNLSKLKRFISLKKDVARFVFLLKWGVR